MAIIISPMMNKVTYGSYFMIKKESEQEEKK